MSSAGTLEFRILGPIEIARDGQVSSLGRSKPAQLLALLLLRANEAVDSEVLIDLMWGESPPATARKSLQTHVWHLRRLIEPADDPSVLLTHGSSYELRVSPHQVDAFLFDDLAGEGGVALSAGDELNARELLDRALRLWRGPPLAEFRYSEFAQSEIRRLEAQYLQVLEDRARADLALGRHTELVGELRRAVSEHPTREQLRELLALALCRSGRFGEALQVCRDAAAVLQEELGVAPGPGLFDLMERVERRDSSLAWNPPHIGEPPTQPRPPLSRPMVGRDREMNQLHSIFDDVYDGRGWVVTVSGQAGMGKTRLIKELEPYVQMRGGRMLWGRAQRDVAAAAFWPVIEILTTHLAPLEDGQVDAIGPQSAALVELLPEMGRRLGELDESTTGPDDPQETRLQLFRSITSYLTRASELEPLVVVIDDLQWADDSTLHLVSHLAPRLGDARVLLGAAWRDSDDDLGHQLDETLKELPRGPRHQSFSLAPLSTDEVAEYVAATIGADPEADPDVIHRVTGGNPFFLVELTSLLAPTPTGEGGRDFPSTLSSVIRQRIGSLPVATGEVLTAGAVIGSVFDPHLVVAVVGHEPNRTLELLDQAVSAGILDHNQAEGYSFSHDLIREVLLADLSVSQRNRLHALTARSLEDLVGPRPGQVASQLAFHYARSGQPPHLERAVGYEILAGDHARQVSAWEEAGAHYQAALHLLERLGTEATERAAELQLRLSTCRRLSGDIVGASNDLFDAFATYRRTRNAAGMARVIIDGLSDELFIGADRAIAMADEALAANHHAPPDLRARLLARRAWEPLGFDAASNRAAQEAIELAVDHGLTDIQAIMQDRETHRVIHEGRFSEARSLARAGHRAAHQVGNSELAAHSLAEIMGTHNMEGDFDAGLDGAHRVIEYSDEYRSQFWGQLARIVAARIHLLRGEFEEMEEMIGDIPEQTFLSPLLVRAAWAERTGDLERADALVARAVEILPLHRMAAFVRAIYLGSRSRIASSRGDESTARYAFAGWRSSVAESFGGYRMAAIGEIDAALASLGDQDLLSKMYEELISTDARATFPVWPLDHMRGRIALRLGEVAKAGEHFETGRRWAKRERLYSEEGRNLLGLASAAVERGQPHEALVQEAKKLLPNTYPAEVEQLS